MATCGASVFAIDIDPIAIEVGRTKASKLGLTSCRFLVADGAATGLPGSCFDTVVLAEVLEHAADPKALLVEARRLVRSAGHIIVSVPNEYAIPDWNHHRIWSKRALEEVLFEVFGSKPTWIPGVPRQWLACGIQVEKRESKRGTVSEDGLLQHFLSPVPCKPLDNPPLVSVVIPTHNRRQWLSESIESWLNQTWDNIEIIVVDDASTDGSPELIRSYERRYPEIIKGILRARNGGKASAVNRALQEVKGTYTVVFDDDDIALPRRLEVQVRYMEQHPDVDLLYSGAVLFAGNPPSVLQYFSAVDYPRDQLLFLECLGNRFHAASILLRTKAMIEIGGMDPDLVRAQDYDAWLRLLISGHRVAALDVPVALQRIHRGMRGTDAVRIPYSQVTQKTLEYERNIFRKLYPRLELHKLVPDLERLEHPAVEVEALLLRAIIMARRGLLDLVERDLDAISRKVPHKLSPRSGEWARELRDTIESMACEHSRAGQLTAVIDTILQGT